MTGLTVLRRLVDLFHVIISWFLTLSDSNWAALLAWEIPKAETGGGEEGKRAPLWFSQNESPVTRASSVLDSCNRVTLKSGSTLAFAFSLLCSPASHGPWVRRPPSPLTQRPSEPGSPAASLGAALRGAPPPTSTLQSLLAGAGWLSFPSGQSGVLLVLSFSNPVVVQSLSHVWLLATPWIAARQASLSFTISRSLLKRMSIELAMSSNHVTLCLLLLLLPSWVLSSHRAARVLELQLQHQSFQWIIKVDFL